MKKSFIILILIAIVVFGLIYYFYFLNMEETTLPVNEEIAGEEQVDVGQEETQDVDHSDVSVEKNPYVGDDFTFLPPMDWIQVEIPSTLVAYQNVKEIQPQNSAAEKVHFKSYMAVSFDSTNGQTLPEIVDLVKKQIESVALGTSFTLETSGQIDNESAKFIEADMLMQEVNFKVMIAIVLKGDKYFTISSNTTKEKWSEYRDFFYDSAESFEFKY